MVSVYFSMVSSFSRICSLKPSWLNDIDKKMHSGNVVSLVWFHLGFNFNVGNSMTSSTDFFCECNTFTFVFKQLSQLGIIKWKNKLIHYFFIKMVDSIPFFFLLKRKTIPNYITVNKLRLKMHPLIKNCKLSKNTKKTLDLMLNIFLEGFFWISFQQLRLLRRASCWQMIQKKPSKGLHWLESLGFSHQILKGI